MEEGTEDGRAKEVKETKEVRRIREEERKTKIAQDLRGRRVSKR